MSALSRSKPGFGGPAGVSCFGSAAKAAAAKPKVRTAKAIPRAFMMGLLLLSCCPLWSRRWDELGPCERDQGQARRAGSKIQPVGRCKRRTSEGPDARGRGVRRLALAALAAGVACLGCGTHKPTTPIRPPGSNSISDGFTFTRADA